MFLMLAEAMRLPCAPRGVPGEPLLVHRGLQHLARPVAGVFAPRSHPAGLFISCRSGDDVLAGKPPGTRGNLRRRMLGHAVWRSAALILLGIFLRSLSSRSRTYWTFEDTLTQIGLGYTFLFLLAFTSLRVQIAAFVAILVAFWGAHLRSIPCRVPRASITPRSACGRTGRISTLGFLAHFNKNSNLAWAFDVWFLNLFPRERPFLFNSGGWSTLSFIPTLATMILGLWAGRWLQTSRATIETLKGLIAGGVALTLAGLALAVAAHQPHREAQLDVTYTLYSGGLILLILAVFYALIEWKGWRRWSFPLLVIGANSIADLRHELDDRALRHGGPGPSPGSSGPLVPYHGRAVRAGAARDRPRCSFSG